MEFISEIAILDPWPGMEEADKAERFIIGALEAATEALCSHPFHRPCAACLEPLSDVEDNDG